MHVQNKIWNNTEDVYHQISLMSGGGLALGTTNKFHAGLIGLPFTTLEIATLTFHDHVVFTAVMPHHNTCPFCNIFWMILGKSESFDYFKNIDILDAVFRRCPGVQKRWSEAGGQEVRTELGILG